MGRTTDYQRSGTVRDQRRYKIASADHRCGNIRPGQSGNRSILCEKRLLMIVYVSQGKSEFIGRTVAKPHVKLLEDDYVRPEFPPSLEWYDVHRGMEHAGELLATFELLQVNIV